MDEPELSKLESQIEQMLSTHGRLVQENDSLRDQLAKVRQERAVLHEQKQNAMGRVKRIISQLKDEVKQ